MGTTAGSRLVLRARTGFVALLVLAALVATRIGRGTGVLLAALGVFALAGGFGLVRCPLIMVGRALAGRAASLGSKSTHSVLLGQDELIIREIVFVVHSGAEVGPVGRVVGVHDSCVDGTDVVVGLFPAGEGKGAIARTMVAGHERASVRIMAWIRGIRGVDIREGLGVVALPLAVAPLVLQFVLPSTSSSQVGVVI